MIDEAPKSPVNLPELVGEIVSHVDDPGDLLKCARLNKLWSAEALPRLYGTSVNDMKWRTPDIDSLNCLLTASPARFDMAMAIADHLVLCPARAVPSEESPSHRMDPAKRLVCSENCRALRDRKRAEALLRPDGKGFRTIAIPFEMLEHDLSDVADLILHPRLEFLLIEELYVKIFALELRRQQRELTESYAGGGPLRMKFPNLKALSIYHSGYRIQLWPLFDFLGFLNLEFFHLEQAAEDLGRDPDARDIISHLTRMPKLRALVLLTSCDSLYIEQVNAGPTPARPLPELRALYLGEDNWRWIEIMPKFEKLQILKLRRWLRRSHGRGPDSLKKLARVIVECPELKVIDIQIKAQPSPLEENSFTYSKFLLDTAIACPWLVKLSLDVPDDKEANMSANEFSALLAVLLDIQSLALNLKLCIGGSTLQQLASHCPDLRILDLDQTQLLVPYESLAKTPSIPGLKQLRLKQVWFRQPRHFLPPGRLKRLATEWGRVFPGLSNLPCPDDVHHMSDQRVVNPFGNKVQDHSDEEGMTTRMDVDEDAGEDGEHRAPPDAEDKQSDWFTVRLRLWRALGYGRDLQAMYKAQYMWQTNFEIETLGWPVIPVQAFSDPIPHSTSRTRVDSRKRSAIMY